MALDLAEKDFFSLGNEIGKNIIIFGVDMSSSLNIDNKKNNILILGKGPTKGLEHTLDCRKIVFNQLYLTKYKIFCKLAL